VTGRSGPPSTDPSGGQLASKPATSPTAPAAADEAGKRRWEAIHATPSPVTGGAGEPGGDLAGRDVELAGVGLESALVAGGVGVAAAGVVRWPWRVLRRRALACRGGLWSRGRFFGQARLVKGPDGQAHHLNRVTISHRASDEAWRTSEIDCPPASAQRGPGCGAPGPVCGIMPGHPGEGWSDLRDQRC